MSAAIRAAVRAAMHDAGAGDRGDLELAVHEVVVNACEHGRAPVTVEIRRDGDRIEVVVRDAGPGPADPTAPPIEVGSERGRGRWLAHQLAVVRERSTAEGFEVRLRPRDEAVEATG